MNRLLNNLFPTNPKFPTWTEEHPKVFVLLLALFLLLPLRLMANIFSNSIDILYALPGVIFFAMGIFYLYKFLRRNK